MANKKNLSELKDKGYPVSKAGKLKIGKVMLEFKDEDLHSGSKEGPKVEDRDQALAIAFSEGRKADKKKRK